MNSTMRLCILLLISSIACMDNGHKRQTTYLASTWPEENYAKWFDYFAAAPMLVAHIGHIRTLAKHADFSIKEHEPAGGFKFVKNTAFFTSAMGEVTDALHNAFTAVGVNAFSIENHKIKNFDGYFKELITVLLNSPVAKLSLYTAGSSKQITKSTVECLNIIKSAGPAFDTTQGLLLETLAALLRKLTGKARKVDELMDSINDTPLPVHKRVARQRKRANGEHLNMLADSNDQQNTRIQNITILLKKSLTCLSNIKEIWWKFAERFFYFDVDISESLPEHINMISSTFADDAFDDNAIHKTTTLEKNVHPVIVSHRKILMGDVESLKQVFIRLRGLAPVFTKAFYQQRLLSEMNSLMTSDIPNESAMIRQMYDNATSTVSEIKAMMIKNNLTTEAG